MRRQPQPVPPMEQRRQPGLSVTLPYPRRIDQCQSCGVRMEFAELRRWQECDEYDKPTPVLVILCERCEKTLINAHARLYRQIDKWAPWPGAMELCLGCRFLDALACRSALLKANGGPGLPVTPGRSIDAHLNYGGGRGEFKRMYQSPPQKCEGFEAPEPEGETRMTGDGGYGT